MLAVNGSAGAGTADPERKLVLVVDDEEMVRALVQATLRRGPYQVLTAGDGAAALAAARAHRPDAVILDVTMPGLDGVEVCRGLKADAATRHAVVIMLTARMQPDDHARARAAGADDYLVKPFRPGELLQRLGNRLGG
ncbi:MAG TPA: response regulator [Chloroflexota bacterium]|nr:response regulator [Chloroflexota bacterium]